MSPATAAPAMSVFVVFIWFFCFLLLNSSICGGSHREALKMVWMFEYGCFSTKITLRLGPMELEILQFLRRLRFRSDA